MWIFSAAIVVAALPASQPQSSYEAAVEARTHGRNAEAEARLLQILATDPSNDDARVQLGLVLLAQRRLIEADAQFNAVLAHNPNYDDARIGRAWVAEQLGKPDAALAQLAQVGDSTRTEVSATRSRIASASSPTNRVGWRTDIDSTIARVEGSSDWYEAQLSLTRVEADRSSLRVGTNWARRFGRSDVMIEVVGEKSLREGHSVYLGFGATPQADFLPRHRLVAGGRFKLAHNRGEPTIATLDIKRSAYTAGTIHTLAPGIEQYINGGRAWLTGQLINLFDEQGRYHLGYNVRADALAGDRITLYAGYADAPDTSDGRAVSSSSLYGGLRWSVSDFQTIRASLSFDNRDGGPDRVQVGVGASTSF